jgi:hypothetical protein
MNTELLPLRVRRKIRFEVRQPAVPGPCWIWQGCRDPKSQYGRVQVERRLWYTHRWVYETLVGAIPEGLHLDHLCRVRECCNPSHVEPVSAKTNSERGIRAATMYCPSGHLYAGDNLRTHTDIRGYTRRVCRQCQSTHAAAWRAARAKRRESTWAKYLDGEAAAS